MDANASPPAGFEPLFRSSPFSETVGPFFYRKEPDGSFVVGMRVLPKHACSSPCSTSPLATAPRSARSRRRR